MTTTHGRRHAPGGRSPWRRAWAAAVGASLAVPLVSAGGTPAAAQPANLVVNAGFESGTQGWKAAGAALSRVPGGSEGSWSGRLTNSSGAPRTAALNDVANTVDPTTAGVPVTATAWVRTSAPGTTVAIRLMEYAGSTLRGQQLTSRWLRTSGWQQVSVTYVPRTTGATLDLNVLAWALPAGQNVDVDGVTASTAPVAAGPPPAPVAAGWKLAWSDEFTGSAVDTAKWNVRDSTRNGNEQSYLLARNVTQAGGVLTITARREDVGGRAYSSGYLDTVGRTRFGVGTRYEIRAKVPTVKGRSQGLWPAFWLRSNETPGEIDVAEWYGSPHPRLPAAHRQVDNVVHEDTNGGRAKSGRSVTLPDGAQPSDGFHVYAVEVLPDGISFFVDGVRSHTVTRAEHPWVSSMLDSTWNMRLNFQVGKDGSWATAPTRDTRLPAHFEVDYVRVYQR